MLTDSDYLIVYGTLRPAFTNSFARYLRQHSQYVGEGSFPGQLFDLGNYPGAIYQQDSLQLVWGTMYDIRQHKHTLLPYLDDYEGINEPIGQSHEYIRTIIPVSWSEGSFNCWIYLYNMPVAGKKIIGSGDYEHYVGS
ncbi:gamma-glutamylcyclotransferase family protein [Spirosoma validum]|uniref:Gamma-glutamylcyclotransferase n=1 Tax=Spirosoma validum TaxID=2771355 RepID=A0A927AYP2_9BACT|nr:gamma-glutamylcyclotransferase family protein [Spirosoma validum]MBD2752190.1 gamma-glutamylcyclotransferase [Spirosoma validum]